MPRIFLIKKKAKNTNYGKNITQKRHCALFFSITCVLLLRIMLRDARKTCNKTQRAMNEYGLSFCVGAFVYEYCEDMKIIKDDIGDFCK